MSFAVGADAYDRFMGRYSLPLASLFSDFARVGSGSRVLDVGCGTGALTDELIVRLGGSSVAAVDPSESFVTAIRERYPDLLVHEADSAGLPFEIDDFDATLAQLVVHFMDDPVAGIMEMARVTKPGGVVAACVWDHAEGGGPLNGFWDAVHSLDANAPGEADLPGTRRGALARLFESAGLGSIVETDLTVVVEHPTFDEWWEPFTFGVGPAGAYVASLDPGRAEELRARCHELLPTEPFKVHARAWAARGIVG